MICWKARLWAPGFWERRGNMITQMQLAQVKEAAPRFARAGEEQKNKALLQMAKCLVDSTEKILEANSRDMAAAREKISPVMLDRLRLDAARVGAMAEGIRQVAGLPDPVGRILDRQMRPNGMVISKVACPMGVIGIIYESRPNVTSDAAALAVKSGNACVLRCGKEAHESAKAIVKALQEGLIEAGLPKEGLCLVEDTSRKSARTLMEAVGYVDLLIPRGGAGLIQSCRENAKVPCIQTGTGICHLYVDKDADLEMALQVLKNGKVSRPSVCNALEVCLVHRDVAKAFLPGLYRVLVTECATPVELRLCPEALAFIPGKKAEPEDFDREFLDYILAVKVVENAEEAICHIAAHSTGHSEAIITENAETARIFTTQVDSAAVYVNCSTRFTDGGEFGLGCEMGISTQKLHARGPMGLQELCAYKYIIQGTGQTR